jgi:hypothetical protein
VVFAAAKAAQVDDDRNNENNQIDPGNGLPSVGHPGIGQGGQGQEKESHERNQEAVIGSLQIIRSKEDKYKSNAWKRYKKDQQ